MQRTESVKASAEKTDRDIAAYHGRTKRPISSKTLQSDLSDSWPLDFAYEADSDLAPLKSRKEDQSRKKSATAEAYGFRGSFIDLGDLVRCSALGIRHYGRAPSFVTCKDESNSLRRLPRTLRSQIREIGIPDELTAADDRDNLDYAKEFGSNLVQATVNVQLLTLPVPDDLIAGGGSDKGQHEFRWWNFTKQLSTPSNVANMRSFALYILRHTVNSASQSSSTQQP